MPYSSPSNFIAREKSDSKKKVVACIGDSIMHGSEQAISGGAVGTIYHFLP
jgi:hypothetical protein